jgi:hypothetical protein
VARCNPAGPAAPTDAYRRRIHHTQRLLACLSLPGQRAVTPHASRADAKLNIRLQLFDRAGNLHNQLLCIVPTPVGFRGKSLAVLFKRLSIIQRVEPGVSE